MELVPVAKKLTPAMRKKAGLPQHLSLSPQRINRNAWYYEEPRHIDVVTWITVTNGQRVPVHVHLSWKSLERSMRRYRAYRRSVSAGAPHAD